MQNLKTTLPTSIKTKKQAEKFLKELSLNGETFHPEDDANEIVWNLPKNQIPNKIECDKLNQLMNQCMHVKNFDPCEFLLSI